MSHSEKCFVGGKAARKVGGGSLTREKSIRTLALWIYVYKYIYILNNHTRKHFEVLGTVGLETWECVLLVTYKWYFKHNIAKQSFLNYHNLYTDVKPTSFICLYVFIRSTLSFRMGAAEGSRKWVGIRACIARISVDDAGLDDRCNICGQNKFRR